MFCIERKHWCTLPVWLLATNTWKRVLEHHDPIVVICYDQWNSTYLSRCNHKITIIGSFFLTSWSILHFSAGKKNRSKYKIQYLAIGIWGIMFLYGMPFIDYHWWFWSDYKAFMMWTNENKKMRSASQLKMEQIVFPTGNIFQRDRYFEETFIECVCYMKTLILR